MAELYNELIKNNKKWVASKLSEDPEFFEKLAKGQQPPVLWIGCADSRVPANEIIGAQPGEVFVHRNIANMVIHTDMNMLSVLDYAVNVLKVRHVIVCGHYDCGGVKSALDGRTHGLVDNWLRNIRDVYYNHRESFQDIEDQREKINLLCELNVAQQVANVSHTNIVQNAWDQGQELSVHGWIYDIHDGLLKKLTPVINSVDQIPEQYRAKKILL